MTASRHLLRCTSAAAAVLALSLSATAEVKADTELVFATGPVGGSWHPIGVALGEIWGQDLGITTHVELGGGEANILGVDRGLFDLGLAQSFAAYNAAQGRPPFDAQHEGVRAIAQLYPNIQQTVIWADSDIQSVEDLSGRVIAPGPEGFGGETIARAILAERDMSYDDMRRVEHVGYSDAVTLMRDGHVDVFWPNTLAPAPSIAELASVGQGVRIVEIEDDIAEALEADNPGLFRLTIPGGTYQGQDEDVQTISTATVIIVSAEMDDDLVYSLTESLIDNRQRLLDVSAALETFQAETAPEGLGVDLHPGAEAYYREHGLID